MSGPYFDEQDEKKAKGQVYIDLLQKFEYLPTYGPHNHLVVSCKLGGVEYNPVKPGTNKGLATGNLKYLVFAYALETDDGSLSLSPSGRRRTSAPLGPQMRENLAHGEQRKAAMEKTARPTPAAAAAAEAAQRAADRSGQ